MARPTPSTSFATVESERDLTRLIERSKRSTGLRLPAAFARGPVGSREPAPLSGLLGRGRGGEVRLKLYLTMALLAGSTKTKGGKAHTISDVSSPTWARLLALPDPSSQGARRISDAQNQLADLKLIRVDRRQGRVPTITLLHAAGTGKAFAEPGTPYLRIPLELWERRWIWTLNGKELAVLVALIDLCYGKGRTGRPGPQPLSAVDDTYYGMSEDTWRLASQSLESVGLLSTDIEPVRMDLETTRPRKRYDLHLERLSAPPPNGIDPH